MDKVKFKKKITINYDGLTTDKYLDIIDSQNSSKISNFQHTKDWVVEQSNIITFDIKDIGESSLSSQHKNLKDFINIYVDGSNLQSVDQYYFKTSDERLLNIENVTEEDIEYMEENIFIYARDNDGWVLVSTREEKNLDAIVLDEINNIKVTKIDYNASQNSEFNSIVIPEGIIEIM